MSKKDEYITIKIPKSALSGIFEINVDNSVTVDSNIPFCWGPYSSLSIYYSSEYRDEVNKALDNITNEMPKQKRGIPRLD